MTSRQTNLHLGAEKAWLPEDQRIDDAGIEERIQQGIFQADQLAERFRKIARDFRDDPARVRHVLFRAGQSLREHQLVALEISAAQFDDTTADAMRKITDAAEGVARRFEETLSLSSTPTTAVVPSAPTVSNDEVLKAIADLARRVDTLTQATTTISSDEPGDPGEDDDPQMTMFAEDRKSEAKPKKHLDEIFASTHPRFREATTVVRSALIAGGIPLPARDLARIIREAIPEFNVDGKSVPNRLLKMDLVRVARPNRPRPVKFWWGPDIPEGYERAG